MENFAQQFFDIHVVPNYDAWLSQPTDLRLAMNAVVSLYHMADYFWNSFYETDCRVYSTKKSGEFRAELARRSDDYALLRDVAEAHKHMRLHRSERIVTTSTQTVVDSTAYGEASYGSGPFGGGLSIVVELDDHTKQHLSYTAKMVKQLWESKLKETS
jgi:hypothetical protein